MIGGVDRDYSTTSSSAGTAAYATHVCLPLASARREAFHIGDVGRTTACHVAPPHSHGWAEAGTDLGSVAVT